MARPGGKRILICFISPISINIYRLFARPELRYIRRNTATHGTTSIHYRCVPRHSVPSSSRTGERFLRDESARPIGISPLYFGDETHGYKDLSFHLYFPFARERSVVRDISTFNEEARLHEEALSNIVHHDFAMIPSSANLLHGKPTFYTRTCVCRDLCTPLARYTRLVK